MFSYLNIEKEIKNIRSCGAEVFSIGRSAYGLPLYCVKVGNSGKKIIVSASIHAREILTAKLCLAQINYALKNESVGQIYFLPCLNPDGAILYSQGDEFFGANAQKIQKINGGRNDYSLFKANANGVDLNVNFPARWGTGAQNRYNPSSESFVGKYPLDQPESKALSKFTELVAPNATVSYHAKGQIVYWYFHQTENLIRDKKIASAVAKSLGYALGESQTNSAGGYKDYCIEKYGIVAMTIEIISDKCVHPLPDSALPQEEIVKHLNLPQRLIKLLEKYN